MWANLTNSQPPWKSKGKTVGSPNNPSRSSSSSSTSTSNPITSPISSSNSTPPSSPHSDPDSITNLALRKDEDDGVVHATHQNRLGARVVDPIGIDLSIQSTDLERERNERQSRTSSVGRNQNGQSQRVGQSQSTASEINKGTFDSSKGVNPISRESSESKEMPTLLINPSLKSINPPTSTSVTRSDSKSQTIPIPIQPKAIRPPLEPSTSQANLLEESLQEAMAKDEIPNLISPPIPARLPSPVINHSPVTSRPTSRNNVRNSLNLIRGGGVGGGSGFSRVSTPDRDRDYDHELGRNSNTSSPLNESRRISNDLKNAIGEALNSSPSIPSPDKSTSSSNSTPSRPSLLSQLSSRSTRSTSIPQLNIFGDVITTISASERNQNQPHTLLTRPQSTWFPDESSPSSKRHSRAFSQISRAGIIVGNESDEMVDQDGKDLNWDGHNHEMILEGEGLNLNERLNGDVEDKPGFWNTISKGFGTQSESDTSSNQQNQDETELNKVEEGQTGFLDAISRLRSLIGPAEPESPNRWIQDHEKQLSSALAQSSETGDGEGKGKGTSGEDLKSSNLSKKQLLRLQDKYQAPKSKICLHHGLFGFNSLGPKSIPSLTLNYWRGVSEVLEANGTEVLVTEVPASASIKERAIVLRDLLEERFPNSSCALICHSMGGLDARYMISHLKGSYSFKVTSLTTIASPHRGSAFADYMINEVIGKDRMPTLLNALKALKVPGGGEAFQDLTRESMTRFNEVTKDDPDCLYFSWGASFRPGFLNEFRIPWGIIHAEEGENDGLVSVSSSMWGQYQGTLDDVSHLHLIGWVNKPLMAALGRDHFRPTDFYLQICEDLAKEGL